MDAIDYAMEYVVDKNVEKHNNEIRMDNFITQAKDRSILTLILHCKIKKLGRNTNINDKNNNKLIIDAYFDLYNYLVKKKIIKEKIGKSFILTADYMYTINKKLIETNKLKELINTNSGDFPDLLKCYTINYEELSSFLQNYNYNESDATKYIIDISKADKRLTGGKSYKRGKNCSIGKVKRKYKKNNKTKKKK